jgi:hypothetical protein
MPQISTARARAARSASEADDQALGIPISAMNAAEHEDVAMGEIDHADDAVDHRVADRDQPVDRAERQPVDQLLEKIVHPRTALFLVDVRQHAERAHIDLEHRLFLVELVAVALADRDDLPDDLGVEA